MNHQGRTWTVSDILAGHGIFPWTVPLSVHPAEVVELAGELAQHTPGRDTPEGAARLEAATRELLATVAPAIWWGCPR